MTNTRTHGTAALVAGLAALTVLATACSLSTSDATHGGTSAHRNGTETVGPIGTSGNYSPPPSRIVSSPTDTDPVSPDTQPDTPPPTPPDTPPASGSSHGAGKAPLATAQELLSHHLRTGEDEYVVELPGGFEAVLFDTTGHLRFWSSVDGVHWHQDQTSTYRYDPRDAKGQRVSAEGALLTGMKNATFILHGVFSGDGSGLAMAYTYGPSGWGPVIPAGTPAKRDGTKLVVAAKLPGEYSGYKVSYRGLSFSHGYLVASDCDAAHANAECGKPGTLIKSWWLWNAGEQDFRSAQ